MYPLTVVPSRVSMLVSAVPVFPKDQQVPHRFWYFTGGDYPLVALVVLRWVVVLVTATVH